MADEDEKRKTKEMPDKFGTKKSRLDSSSSGNRKRDGASGGIHPDQRALLSRPKHPSAGGTFVKRYSAAPTPQQPPSISAEARQSQTTATISKPRQPPNENNAKHSAPEKAAPALKRPRLEDTFVASSQSATEKEKWQQKSGTETTAEKQPTAKEKERSRPPSTLEEFPLLQQSAMTPPNLSEEIALGLTNGADDALMANIKPSTNWKSHFGPIENETQAQIYRDTFMVFCFKHLNSFKYIF